MVPGSEFPLVKVSVNESDMLLVYQDGLARIWDIKTQEFRRSTTADKADELLAREQWMTWKVDFELFLIGDMLIIK